MSIKPNEYTYNQLVLNFAKKRDLDMVMKLNKEALDKYGIIPNKFSYNNLMLCYAKMNKPNEAENVLREMIDKGIKPDVVTYTTLIDAYKRTDNFEKCWELFNECRHWRLDGKDVDEQLLSFMVRIAGSTHESEKALKIFSELEAHGYLE